MTETLQQKHHDDQAQEEGDEAEVEGIQEAPGLLQVGKDSSRHQEADSHGDAQQRHQVPAGCPPEAPAPARGQPGDGCAG
ncbi:unnamed protein product, partial [Gulo gulo]